MQRYIIRRLLLIAPIIIGVSLIVFGVMHLVPGNVVLLRMSQSPGSTPQQIEQMTHDLGLDRSLPVQYKQWVGDLVQGNMQKSLWTGEPVSKELANTIPVTFELALIAAAIAIILGLTTGVAAAVWEGRWIDYLSRVIVILGLSVPTFATATLALLVGSIWLGWSPAVFYEPFTHSPMSNLQQMILPAALLGFALSASISRMTRATMLEVIQQDYMRTARAKGLNGNIVIWRHGLKNALAPVVTIIGLQFAYLMGGTVVIETIFGLPGMGKLMFDAINERDYTTIQGAVLVVALAFIVVNLITDISYAFIDPRVKYG